MNMISFNFVVWHYIFRLEICKIRSLNDNVYMRVNGKTFLNRWDLNNNKNKIVEVLCKLLTEDV